MTYKETYKETVKKLVGLCKLIDKSEEQTKILFKVVDKLEKRISTLEKVLSSHAKQIGQLREEEIKTWETTDTSGDKTIWVGKK